MSSGVERDGQPRPALTHEQARQRPVRLPVDARSARVPQPACVALPARDRQDPEQPPSHRPRMRSSCTCVRGLEVATFDAKHTLEAPATWKPNPSTDVMRRRACDGPKTSRGHTPVAPAAPVVTAPVPQCTPTHRSRRHLSGLRASETQLPLARVLDHLGLTRVCVARSAARCACPIHRADVRDGRLV